MMELREDPDFAFLVGKVRVRESRLIHPGLFYQLAEIKSWQEFFSTLSSHYPGALGSSPREVEENLEEEYVQELKELFQLSPDPSLFFPFLWRKEVFNLITVYRYFQGFPVSPPSREYLIPLTIYKKVIEEHNLSPLPSPYREWMEESLQEGEEETLERRILKESLSLSPPFPLLREFLRQEIDFYNLRVLWKRWEGEGKERFLEGGRISPEDWENISAREEDDALIRILRTGGYEALAEEGWVYLREKREDWRMELNFRRLRLKVFKDTLYTPFAPETPLFYLLRKENQLRNIRWLIRGRTGGLSPEEIKERLGPFDVS